jgi:hypothetical protein
MPDDETRGTMACTTDALIERNDSRNRRTPASRRSTSVVDAALAAFVFGLAAAVVVGGGLHREELEIAAAGFSYAGCLTVVLAVSRTLERTSRDRSDRLVSKSSSRWPREPA